MFEKARSEGTLFAIEVSTRLANGERTGQEVLIDLQNSPGRSA